MGTFSKDNLNPLYCLLKDIKKIDEEILAAVSGGSSGGGSQYTWITACASDNGRQIRVRSDNSSGAVTYWELNSNTQITGITAVKCTGTPANYNTPAQYTVVGTGVSGYVNTTASPFTIAANTVHGVTYTIITGSATVQIGSGNPLTKTIGEAGGYEATTLLSQSFTFTATTTDCVIQIQTLS